MICNFPIPYPDELLYSVFARYGDRMQYPSAQAIVRDLFQSSEAIATLGFPSYLGNLVSNLHPGHYYTVDRIINNHTLLPFYTPFLPSNRLDLLRRKMEVGGGKAISLQIGLGGDIPPLEWLRFCPRCTKEDRKQFEECPVQITTFAIANDIGCGYNLLRQLDKLPLTANMLAQLVETDEVLAVRRVQWLAQCYQQEDIYPTRGQFLRRERLW